MDVYVEKRRVDEPLPPEILPHLVKPKKPLPLPFEITVEPDKREISPSIIPESERPFYDRIQALRPKFHKQLLRVWNEFKKDFLKTIPIEKVFTPIQTNAADKMLKDMERIANIGFSQGVSLGNEYFEDQFGVRGISASQQRRVVQRHLRTFRTKSKALFVDDVELLLGQAPTDQSESILSGFDRFLLGYANVGAALAYDIFARNIDLLNKAVDRLFSIAGKDVPRDAVKVRWVMLETAVHSPDCNTLSFGKDGSGFWDARELYEQGMLPQSSNLDCGGNCRCHLSPHVGEKREGVKWLEKITTVERSRNTLSAITDIDSDELSELFDKKNFDIPRVIRNLIIGTIGFRRRTFWNKLPDRGVQVTIIQNAPEFNIVGQTGMSIRAGVFSPSGPIKLQISLPSGVRLETLNATQKRQIREKMAHELGHTFMSFDERTRLVGTLHNVRAADEIFDAARQQRAISLLGLQQQFNRIIAIIPPGKLTALQKKDVAIMRQLINDPDEFVTKLFDAVLAGKKFGRVDAEQVHRLFDRAITQYATSANIVRGYQLYRVDEYFAEWFSILLTNPEKAAFLNPRLNRVMAKHFPDMFERTAAKRARTLLPNSIVSGFRTDLPHPTGFTPLGPNLESLAVTTRNVTSGSKRLTTAVARDEVKTIIEATPGLHRSEFFEKLDLVFLDKFQVARESGSRTHLAFFKDNKFFINYDKWLQLSTEGKTNVLVDVIGRNIWATQPSSRQTIRQTYATYVGGTLKALDDKANIQFARGAPRLLDLKTLVTGVDELGRPVTRTVAGETIKIGRNIDFWVRNFDNFEPTLRGITDLPIINIESLRNPQAFWLEWFKLFIIHPGYSKVYEPILRNVFLDFINTNSPIRKDIRSVFGRTLQKQLLFEKGIFANVVRILQTFKGAVGRWVTTRFGRKVFIKDPKFKGANDAVDKFFGVNKAPGLVSDSLPSFRQLRINKKVNLATASLLSEGNPMRTFLQKTGGNTIERAWGSGDLAMMGTIRMGVRKNFGGGVFDFVPKKSPRSSTKFFGELTPAEIKLRAVDIAADMRENFGIKGLIGSHVEEFGEKWVQVRYTLSQRMLSRAQKNKVTLYRGLSIEDAEEFKGFLAKPPDIQMGALSSWSTNKGWSGLYGNIHLEAEIPTKHILSSSVLGGNHITEWIVMGNGLQTKLKILEGKRLVADLIKRVNRVLNIDKNIDDLLWLHNLPKTAGVQTQKLVNVLK